LISAVDRSIFIGVGGIGMSAIAHVLARRQLPVSGSDLRLSAITQRLQSQGVHIFWSQEAANLEAVIKGLPIQLTPRQIKASGARQVKSKGNGGQGPGVHAMNGEKARIATAKTIAHQAADPCLPQVVCSTAIAANNPEYQAALTLGCPIFHRSDLLAALIKQHKGIAVAGTHGKTTTSSMVGYLLLKAGLDPTIVIGGEVNAWEGNAYVGQGDYMVAEADESDGSLAKLSAYIGVITNIELDHPDHYSSLDEVVEIFKCFSQQCQITIGSLDCGTVRTALKPTISYSLHPESGADYIADDIRQTAQGMTASLWERGKLLAISASRFWGGTT
jgi:UDP-N-acetylmuramate--alanine ligase